MHAKVEMMLNASHVQFPSETKSPGLPLFWREAHLGGVIEALAELVTLRHFLHD